MGRKIGSGEIYLGTNIQTNEEVAIELEQPSFYEVVVEQLQMNLCHQSYKCFFELLIEMRYTLLAPNLFRKKMKFLFREHSGFLMFLNPLFPDEYQFTDEELQVDASDFKELKKFEVSIDFVNELTEQVNSSKDLEFFYELVKSYKHKQMDVAEFYGSAYKLLSGDFNLMKKLGTFLNYETTPSYIKLPTVIGASGDEDQVLNNKFSIYGYKVCPSTKTNNQDYIYIYSPDEVIKKSREMPDVSELENVDARMRESVDWWESRSVELELVLRMLKVAEEEMERALREMERGSWLGNVKLMEYLVQRGVKVKMLKKMNLGDIDKLPVKRLPGVVNLLRRKKEQVVKAMRKLNLMRQLKKIIH